MATTRAIGTGVVVLLVLGVVGWVYTTRTTTDSPSAQNTQVDISADYTIIAFGDSLTAGFGLPASEGYPAQLEALLRNESFSVRVINAGVSGETTRGNLERAAFIRVQNPDIVLLGIGGNDALRSLPLEETKKNIAASIEVLQSGENSPVVILLAMQAPLNAGAAYKNAFDAMYNELGQAYSLTVAPFVTPEVFLEASNKLPDGIHLNETGYGIVAREYILPVVREVLLEVE